MRRGCAVSACVLLLAAAASAQTSGPAPVRVGSSLTTPHKTKDVAPVYPPDAIAARVEGVVIVELRIDANGKVQDVQVLRSIPLLGGAAVEAAKQWEYEPTLLNGTPVPVIMAATVNFTLPRETSSRLPDPVAQQSPCVDQPTSPKALADAFDKGRLPSAADITGTWVEIGFFSADTASTRLAFNVACDGLKRGNTFEMVLLVNAPSLEIHRVGMPVQIGTLKAERGSLTFPVDEAGNIAPGMQCRLTERRTLACFNREYNQGTEFRKMTVPADQMSVTPR